MTNSRNRALEDHLLRAGLTPGQLGEQLGFSDKTVQRWLGGCRPYLRNQYAVAAALRVDHRELWPEDDTANDGPNTSDLVTLYESRLHIPHELWGELSDTSGDVEMKRPRFSGGRVLPAAAAARARSDGSAAPRTRPVGRSRGCCAVGCC